MNPLPERDTFDSVSKPRVLIVVPTLGTRIDFLRRSLSSIRMQDIEADIVIVAPASRGVEVLAGEFQAQFLVDPGSQTKAINLGASRALPHHEFINWLCDDDLLEVGSLRTVVDALDNDPTAVVAYGACRYIDEDDRELWISKAGPWANRLLAWGPDLIPQPGMLIRTAAWRGVNGVDETFRFAFDLDLLLRLRQKGTLIDVGRVVSSFRWHSDSLTVSDRTENLRESEVAKRRALSPSARRWAWLWEKPVRGATRMAAREVARRARVIQRADA